MSRPRKEDGILGDDRLGRFEETPGRESRAVQDEARTNDGTITSERERRQMLRDEFKQEALPPVPKIPGWHLCWLSTNNSQDPISRRARIGYEPVKWDEVPGMDMSYKMRSGEFEGCVSCNEMVLFKLDEAMYQTMMDEYHHRQPAEQEQSIVEQITASQEVDGHGKSLVHMEEGINQLVQRARRPHFA